MCHVIIACKSAPRKALKALSGRRGRQAGQGQNMCRNDRDGAGGKAGDPGADRTGDRPEKRGKGQARQSPLPTGTDARAALPRGQRPSAGTREGRP